MRQVPWKIHTMHNNLKHGELGKVWYISDTDKLFIVNQWLIHGRIMCLYNITMLTLRMFGKAYPPSIIKSSVASCF